MGGEMNQDTHETGKVNEKTGASVARQGTWYLTTVGVLLVCIIALLSILWVRERSARTAAERDRDAAEGARDAAVRKYDGLAQAVGAVMDGALKAQARTIRRDELPTREAKFEGRPRSVLELDPAAGRRMGFAPGDLILVAEDTDETPPVKKD
jgi:hypothetical protein